MRHISIPIIISASFLISLLSATQASGLVCDKFEGNFKGKGGKIECYKLAPDLNIKPIDSGRTGGGGGHVTQPVAPVFDEPINESRARKGGEGGIPCNDPNASREMIIAPPDAPGVRTDPRTGQTYLCSAKAAEGEPVAYELPDGTVVEAPEPIVVTVEDMKNLGLLASTPHQERAPHTLKNYHTNFWVNPNPQTFNTTIGGVPVEVRATPINYTYHYGDGTNITTTNPGYELGQDVWDQETGTSHQYTEPGDYEFSVTTFFRGEFSVAGGPWQVMEGTGEVTSNPQQVRVWRTEVGLVADSCTENPNSWGCPGAKK